MGYFRSELESAIKLKILLQINVLFSVHHILWKYSRQHTVSKAQKKFPEKLPFANNGIFSLRIGISYKTAKFCYKLTFYFPSTIFCGNTEDSILFLQQKGNLQKNCRLRKIGYFCSELESAIQLKILLQINVLLSVHHILLKYRRQHTVSTAKKEFPEKLPFANNGIFSLRIGISYQIENSATNKRLIFRPPYFVEI